LGEFVTAGFKLLKNIVSEVNATRRQTEPVDRNPQRNFFSPADKACSNWDIAPHRNLVALSAEQNDWGIST
jgi:hypothetical protein